MNTIISAILIPIAVCAVTIFTTLLIYEHSCTRQALSNMYERVYFPLFDLVSNAPYSDEIKSMATTILIQSSGVFPIELSEKVMDLTAANYSEFQKYIATACDLCRKNLRYSEFYVLDNGEREASYSLGLSCFALSACIVPLITTIDPKAELLCVILYGILLFMSIRLKRSSNNKKKLQ